MLEIKFRGFAVDEMVNNQWLYGTGIHRTVFAEHFAKEVGQSGETFIWTESGWVQIVEGSQSKYTGLKDKNGREIFENDITELEVDGNIRRFVVKIKTVVREVVSHPSFSDDTAKVAITGVVFEWNRFDLFPCVDENGKFDNLKMVVVGNTFDNPELLEESQ